MNYFTITTNKATADKIKAQCELEEKHGYGRSYKLGKIVENEGFSIVQIVAREDKIKPDELFFLGLFCADK